MFERGRRGYKALCAWRCVQGVAWCAKSAGGTWNNLADIGIIGRYVENILTLGEAIWRAVSVLLAMRAVGVEAYLGGDQGGESAALDEAHLDGWRLN